MPDLITPQYLPASYNGVFFEAITAGSEHGRRGVVGEFPFGEKTKYQDMGIKADKFSISGRFQGPDCIDQTNSLISAVKTPGPGNLVHPTRGAVNVACTSLKIKDALVQGAGETTFDMDFITSGADDNGISGFPVIPGISDILSAVNTSFINNYTPQSLAFFQTGAVSATAYDVLNALASTFANSIPQGSSDTIYQTLYQVQSYAANPQTWADPYNLMDAIAFSFAAIDTYAATPTIEYNAFSVLSNQFAKSSSGIDMVGTCDETLYSTTRILCAAYMMRSSSQIVATTLDQALTYLDAISLIIYEEKQNALTFNDDNLYIALTDFQVTSSKAMLSYAYNLPPIISYNFKGGIPSLVAAHEIFGDCEQALALELRNPNNFPFALGPVIYVLGNVN